MFSVFYCININYNLFGRIITYGGINKLYHFLKFDKKFLNMHNLIIILLLIIIII